MDYWHKPTHIAEDDFKIIFGGMGFLYVRSLRKEENKTAFAQ